MVTQPAWSSALFVFNDNEGQWAAHRAPGHVLGSCTEGGGNAAIRPLQCVAHPQVIGVPTGAGGVGYAAVTPHVRAVLDEALDAVGALLATGRFDRLVYSATSSGALATAIFTVGHDVNQAIVDGLRRLAPG